MAIAIPLLFQNIVTKVAESLDTNVYYRHGTWLELMRQLNETKSATAEIKNNVYPLIMLIHEFEETKRNGILTAKLDFVIVTPSIPTDYFYERYTKNYLPTLYPIYETFINEVENSSYFLGDAEKGFNHTKIDALNMGVIDNSGNVAYKLPDYLDGLVIKGLELTINETICNLERNTLIN